MPGMSLLVLRVSCKLVSAMNAPIEELRVASRTLPTDLPESDGTLAWNQTTMVLVEARSGDESGLGYTYADQSAAHLIEELLAGVVLGLDALAVPAAYLAMVRSVRNLGRGGIAAMAISAVDLA